MSNKNVFFSIIFFLNFVQISFNSNLKFYFKTGGKTEALCHKASIFFNDKNCIYLAFWCVFKDIKHVLHEFFYLKKNFFFEFVCFPPFEKPTNYPRKPLNLGRNQFFCQNHQKSTNIDFSNNSIYQSVKYCVKVSSPKYWWKLTSFHNFIVFWS